eukprot:TRINITY_DN22782_c0_g1_i1.p1 TRINITY_DN22782_c0_g1~~TRINITY_DN22782_c0_g1_i1.p1  ORF type:complete len:114 (+),score=12.16 TRINITY_DN22782_c0_g1_i1:51-344(+)
MAAKEDRIDVSHTSQVLQGEIKELQDKLDELEGKKNTSEIRHKISEIKSVIKAKEKELTQLRWEGAKTAFIAVIFISILYLILIQICLLYTSDAADE